MRTLLPTWDQTFMDMAHVIAKRSKDESTQVGAVLVGSNKVIMACGFNGPSPQLDDSKVNWGDRPQKYAFVFHAEDNCIHFATQSYGDLTTYAPVLYCTHKPCSDCVNRLIRSNVITVYYPIDAPDYPLSRFQVDPMELIHIQKFPKLAMIGIPYNRTNTNP